MVPIESNLCYCDINFSSDIQTMNSQYALVPAQDGKLYLQTPGGNYPTKTRAAEKFAELIQKIDRNSQEALAKVAHYEQQVIDAEKQAYGLVVKAKDEHIGTLKEENAFLRTMLMKSLDAAQSRPIVISEPRELPRATQTTVKVSVHGDGFWANQDAAVFGVFAIICLMAFGSVALQVAASNKNNSQPVPVKVNHERSI